MFIVKPIMFEYEDTYYCDEKEAESFGVFDDTPIDITCGDGVVKQFERSAYSWEACFLNKEHAKEYCDKLNRN